MQACLLTGPFDLCKQTLRGGRVKLQTIMVPETEYQHTEKVALFRSNSDITYAYHGYIRNQSACGVPGEQD